MSLFIICGHGAVTAEDALEMLKMTANMKENPKGYNAEDALDVLKDVANIAEQKGTLGIVTGNGVRIRSGAGTNHSVIGSANEGQEVRIWGESGDWYMIDTGKWISKKYVSIK